jgi:hypothetical protein
MDCFPLYQSPDKPPKRAHFFGEISDFDEKARLAGDGAIWRSTGIGPDQ